MHETVVIHPGDGVGANERIVDRSEKTRHFDQRSLMRRLSAPMCVSLTLMHYAVTQTVMGESPYSDLCGTRCLSIKPKERGITR